MVIELSTDEIGLLISALGWAESSTYDSTVWYYDYCKLQEKLEYYLKHKGEKNEEDSN